MIKIKNKNENKKNKKQICLNSCKLCGSSCKKLNLIQENSDFFEKIRKYLAIIEKKFPIDVCNYCLESINNWHLFYEKCNEVNSKDLTDDSIIENIGQELKMMNIENEGILSSQNQISIPKCDKIKRNRIFKSRNKSSFTEIHSCPFCDLTTESSLLEFQNHLKDLHYDLISFCEICNQYEAKDKLIKHVTNHAVKIYGKNSTTNLFGAAGAKNKTEKLKKFSCDACDSSFGTNRLLKNHIQSRHANERNFICEICNKGFKTDSTLYMHSKTHSNLTPFECKCGTKFKFNHHLKSHIMTKHLQKKLFPCMICKKSFYSKNNLSKHIKVHKNIDEFKCHICNSVLKQKRYLREHLRRVHMRK